MSGSVNKVILLGRVGKDPDVRSNQSGAQFASFSLATSERWKDRQTGEKKEKTEWHNVSVAGDNLVSLVKNYVSKGSNLYIEGKLQTREWQDKDGAKRYTTEIVVGQFNGVITLLDSPKSGDRDERAPSPKSQERRSFAADLDESDIPF